MSYVVTMLPAQNVWVEIKPRDEGEKMVWFRSIGHEQEVANGGESRTMVKTVTFEVKAKDPGGEKTVDAWISKVFDWSVEAFFFLKLLDSINGLCWTGTETRKRPNRTCHGRSG